MGRGIFLSLWAKLFILVLFLGTETGHAKWLLECLNGLGKLSPSYLVLKQKVKFLQRELEELAEKHGCKLNQGVCEPATGTLQKLLQEKHGIKTEVVHSGLHYFLRVSKYFPNGDDLYIDPTFRQFIPEKNQNKAPTIYVGSATELKNLLSSLEVPEIIIKMNYQIQHTEQTVPYWQ